MDFSQILMFELPDFCADFVAGLFLLFFVGEILQEILQAKSSKLKMTKIPDRLLQRGRALLFLP